MVSKRKREDKDDENDEKNKKMRIGTDENDESDRFLISMPECVICLQKVGIDGILTSCCQQPCCKECLCGNFAKEQRCPCCRKEIENIIVNSIPISRILGRFSFEKEKHSLSQLTVQSKIISPKVKGKENDEVILNKWKESNEDVLNEEKTNDKDILNEDIVLELGNKRKISVNGLKENISVIIKDCSNGESMQELKPKEKGILLNGNMWESLSRYSSEINRVLRVRGSKLWDLEGLTKVSVNMFMGKLYVHVREYYVADKRTNMQKPGSVGIALKPEEWNSLCAQRSRVDGAVRSKKA